MPGCTDIQKQSVLIKTVIFKSMKYFKKVSTGIEVLSNSGKTDSENSNGHYNFVGRFLINDLVSQCRVFLLNLMLNRIFFVFN